MEPLRPRPRHRRNHCDASSNASIKLTPFAQPALGRIRWGLAIVSGISRPPEENASPLTKTKGGAFTVRTNLLMANHNDWFLSDVSLFSPHCHQLIVFGKNVQRIKLAPLLRERDARKHQHGFGYSSNSGEWAMGAQAPVVAGACLRTPAQQIGATASNETRT